MSHESVSLSDEELAFAWIEHQGQSRSDYSPPMFRGLVTLVSGVRNAFPNVDTLEDLERVVYDWSREGGLSK